MKLIDKDKIYQKAMDIIQDKADLKDFAIANAIGMAEIIEAEPMKHAVWLRSTNHSISRYCSLCSARHIVGMPNKYCPNCGAKMDGGDPHD